MVNPINRPIICCLNIKQATLFVGIVDLILHMLVVTTLFALYSNPNMIDPYYANSISLIVSPSSSFYSTSIKSINDLNSAPLGTISSANIAAPMTTTTTTTTTSTTASSTTHSPSTSRATNNSLLVRLSLHSTADRPNYYDSEFLNSGSKYSNVNLPRDKSVAFLVTSFSSFLTMMLIYGIMKDRPSYLMPYFSIKVFQVVMGCLTTLGFYSCLPNVRLWIETHHFFPMKKEFLLLDNQTLELFVFSILLTSVLVKLYVVIIVWYCYKHMIQLKSFFSSVATSSHRLSTNMGICNFGDSSMTPGGVGGGVCGGAATSGYKNEDEMFMHGPPKYEEVVKQIRREAQPTSGNGGHDDLLRHQTSLLTAANNNGYELQGAIRRLDSVDEAASGLIGADVSSSSTQAPPYISLPMIAKSTSASPPAGSNASHIV